MAFDWSKFNALADALGSTPITGCGAEAQKRSAISRAYYGVAAPARNALAARMGVPVDQAPMHLPLSDRLKTALDANVKQLGSRSTRCDAGETRRTYDDAVPRLDANLAAQLLIAQQVRPLVAKI